jgi:hypothetical protein
MLKRILSISAIWIICNSCMNLFPIRHHVLKTPYPASHVFNVPVEKLKGSIIHYIQNTNECSLYKNLIFYYYADKIVHIVHDMYNR